MRWTLHELAVRLKDIAGVSSLRADLLRERNDILAAIENEIDADALKYASGVFVSLEELSFSFRKKHMANDPTVKPRTVITPLQRKPRAKETPKKKAHHRTPFIRRKGRSNR